MSRKRTRIELVEGENDINVLNSKRKCNGRNNEKSSETKSASVSDTLFFVVCYSFSFFSQSQIQNRFFFHRENEETKRPIQKMVKLLLVVKSLSLYHIAHHKKMIFSSTFRFYQMNPMTTITMNVTMMKSMRWM